MPCGGIYPVESHFSKVGWKDKKHRCYHCNKVIATVKEASFCEEWDAFIHRKCILSFLNTLEGEVVVNHGHVVCFGNEV